MIAAPNTRPPLTNEPAGGRVNPSNKGRYEPRCLIAGKRKFVFADSSESSKLDINNAWALITRSAVPPLVQPRPHGAPESLTQARPPTRAEA
jgi:hypothetical protein